MTALFTFRRPVVDCNCPPACRQLGSLKMAPLRGRSRVQQRSPGPGLGFARGGCGSRRRVVARSAQPNPSGRLIDAGGQAAGDAVRVQGISLSFDTDSALGAQARTAAVEHAQAGAGSWRMPPAFSSARFTRSWRTRRTRPCPSRRSMAAGAADAGSVPIEVGSQNIKVTVQVVYEIVQ